MYDLAYIAVIPTNNGLSPADNILPIRPLNTGDFAFDHQISTQRNTTRLIWVTHQIIIWLWLVHDHIIHIILFRGIPLP